jgi:hypothetical protein
MMIVAVAMLLVGPVVLVLAWAYEIGRELNR